MGDETTSKTSECPLAAHVTARFSRYQRQRDTAGLKEKWDRNRLAYQSLDPGTGRRWRPNVEAQKDWHSITVSDIVRQKATAATDIINDACMRGGKLSFMLAPDADMPQADVAAPPGNEDELSERAGAIDRRQRRLQRILELAKADLEFERAVSLAAEYGEAFIKGFVANVRRRKLVDTTSGRDVAVVEEQLPGIVARNVYQIFRDLEGESCQEGDGFIDRDELTPAALRRLARGDDTFDQAQVDAIVNERIDRELGDKSAPTVSSSGASTTDDAKRTPRQKAVEASSGALEVLEFWGECPVRTIREHVKARSANVDLPNEPPPDHYADIEAELAELNVDDRDSVEITATVVEGKVIRFMLTLTGAEDRPCWRLPWEDDADQPGGVGVADRLEYAHVSLTGMLRALEDNGKLLANLMLAVKRHYLQTELGKVEPGMVLDVSEDCDDARKAVSAVQLPDVLTPILAMIEKFLELSDLSSMIPRIQQGQGVEEPQTAFELNKRIEQAGKYLARVIRNVDRGLEWVVNRLYEWIELYEEPLDSTRFIFRVQALGFTSFENKVVRLQRILQALRLTLENPTVLALSKLRWLLDEMYKAMEIDPDQVLKSATELRTEAEARQAELAGGEGGDPVERQRAQAEIAVMLATAKDLEARAVLAAEKAGQTAEARQIAKAKAVQELAAASAGGAAAEPAPATPAPSPA